MLAGNNSSVLQDSTVSTPKKRASITDISGRLLDLYVKRDEACLRSDMPSALFIQKQIEAVSEERERVLQSAKSGGRKCQISLNVRSAGISARRR